MKLNHWVQYLYLTDAATTARCRLAYGKHDRMIAICHQIGSHSRKFRMADAVVDRPEALKAEHLLVPLGDCLQLKRWLIANDMVYSTKTHAGPKNSRRIHALRISASD